MIKEEAFYQNLSGNSIFARVSLGDLSFEENILFTHWGLSGPAILQISSYWQPGKQIEIDLMKSKNSNNIKENYNLIHKK